MVSGIGTGVMLSGIDTCVTEFGIGTGSLLVGSGVGLHPHSKTITNIVICAWINLLCLIKTCLTDFQFTDGYISAHPARIEVNAIYDDAPGAWFVGGSEDHLSELMHDSFAIRAFVPQMSERP